MKEDLGENVGKSRVGDNINTDWEKLKTNIRESECKA